jgi:HAD superfamily hydrolase (TIGR01509 family)
MSGGLFTNMLLRETGHEISEEVIRRLKASHAAAYERHKDSVRPLPGARALLDYLTEAGIAWAIATSGAMATAALTLEKIGVDPNKSVVVTRDQVRYAKPNPDLFLAAAERINVPIEETVIVGDAIWDMLASRRARIRRRASLRRLWPG